MQSLDLNLASRPFKNNTLPWVAVSSAVVLLVVMTVWNVRSYQKHSALAEDLRQVYAEARNDLDQFERRERGAQREIERFDIETLVVRADKANEVIGWKAFSWTQLFNLLQDVLPNDVQMVSIRPVFRPQNPQRRGEDKRDKYDGMIPVSVEGGAKSHEAFFALERALLKHPHFDRVEPEGTTLTRTGAVAFQLSFLYDPSPTPPPAEPAAEQPAEVETAQAEGPSADDTVAEPVDGAGAAQAAPAQAEPEPADAGDTTTTGMEAAGSPLPTEGVEEAGTGEAPPVKPAAAAEDPAATEEKPDPKPPGGRKGKRRSGGRGTEGTR